MITLYRLGITPCESDGEGEDHDEWFGSLREARRRRAELIRQDPDGEELKCGSDFEIERVVFADLPKKAMMLAILNRYGGDYAVSRQEVVPAFVAKSMRGFSLKDFGGPVEATIPPHPAKRR